MPQERLGTCNSCGVYEGEDHRTSCAFYEDTCKECGEVQLTEFDKCFEHITDIEELREYALEKVVHIERWIESNKKLNAEIDQLKADKTELIKGFREQTDTINRLIYEQQQREGE